MVLEDAPQSAHPPLCGPQPTLSQRAQASTAARTTQAPMIPGGLSELLGGVSPACARKWGQKPPG